MRSASVFVGLILLSTSVLSADKAAQMLYQEGERYTKEQKPVLAREVFCLASARDPTNQKFKKRCAEASKSASVWAEAVAQEEMRTDSAQAERRLREALKYDPSNKKAADALQSLETRLRDASMAIDQALLYVEKGNVADATTRLSEAQHYKESLSGYSKAEERLKSTVKARDALEALRRGDRTKALTEIVEAEAAYPSAYITDIGKAIRRDVSEEKVSKALAISISKPADRIEHLRKLGEALEVDPSNPRAASLVDSDISDLTSFLLGFDSGSMAGTPAAARISLERLKIIEKWSQHNMRFRESFAREKGGAYPAVLFKPAISIPDECSTLLTSESLRAAIEKSLSPVGHASESADVLTIRISGLACSVVDLPRTNVQRVNSTYVAAANQMANPEYTSLQGQLLVAERDLDRAAAAYLANPNFGTALVLGRIRRQVNELQSALSNTPPYISNEVVQQYQYEKFEASRGYSVRGKLMIVSTDARGFAAELPLQASVEERAQGVSGVLRQDRSGASNSEAVLPSVEAVAAKALNELWSKIDLSSRELATEYLGSIAGDKSRPVEERLAAVLNMRDISTGTKFEYAPPRDALTSALMSSAEALKAYMDVLKLPSQPHAVSASGVALTPRKVDFNSAIASTVSIETDNNKSGSGFFALPDCSIITNAHVVAGAETVVVRDAAKRLYVARVSAQDENRDLALLTTNAKVCSPLTLGNSDAATVGQEVYAIGAPLGLAGTLTRGIISALRSLSGVHHIQLDASINPGNSGGPVLDDHGNVLGVATFKVRGYEGLNFAVAVNEIRIAFGSAFR